MRENTVAKVLHVIGIIEIVLGVLCGIIYIATTSFVVGLLIAVAGSLCSLVYFGFAEILFLLEEISSRLNKQNREFVPEHTRPKYEQYKPTATAPAKS